MFYESNELILIKNKEPQRNIESIQCIDHRLGVEQKLHMDAFERKNKLTTSPPTPPYTCPTVTPCPIPSETVFLICPYLLIFKCLQSIYAMVTFCPRLFWTMLSHYDLCLVSFFSLWTVLPGENTGQMKTEWLWCSQTPGYKRTTFLNIWVGSDSQIRVEICKTLHRQTFYLGISVNILV